MDRGVTICLSLSLSLSLSHTHTHQKVLSQAVYALLYLTSRRPAYSAHAEKCWPSDSRHTTIYFVSLLAVEFTPVIWW
jgi:hypothetical protein